MHLNDLIEHRPASALCIPSRYRPAEERIAGRGNAMSLPAHTAGEFGRLPYTKLATQLHSWRPVLPSIPSWCCRTSRATVPRDQKSARESWR